MEENKNEIIISDINIINEDKNDNEKNESQMKEEIDKIKELLTKENELNTKLKIENDKYKEEISKLELEINKEKENKKEIDIKKENYINEIKLNEDKIIKNYEELSQIKNTLNDRKIEKENIEKQKNKVKFEVKKKNEEINNLNNQQNNNNQDDKICFKNKIEENISSNNDLQSQIELMEKNIEEKITQNKELDKLNEENKSKISEIESIYKKIIVEKIDKLIKNKDMADIQIKFKKINKAKVEEKYLQEEEEKNKLNHIKKQKLFDNLSKSVILKESSELFKIDGKNMDNIGKEEDFFKNLFIQKYSQLNTNGTNKASRIFLRKQSIKESEEKISNLKNEIELNQNSILSLSRKNSELKEEYNSKIDEVNDIYDILSKSQTKLNVYPDKLKKIKGETENTKNSLKQYLSQEEELKNEIDKINLENEIYTQKEEDIKIMKKSLANFPKDTTNAQENIDKKLEKEYEESLNSKTNDLINQLKNKLKAYEMEIKQKLSKKYEASQINYDQKFTQISRITKSKIVNNKYGINKLSIIKNQIIHPGFKCQNCLKEPIIGIRYQCSVCNNYNLCSECEEKNSIANVHPHNFIKIRKNKNNVINNNNNSNINIHMDIKPNEINSINKNNSLINNEHNFENINYSYECTVTKLTAFEYEGAYSSSLTIILKNNGKDPWIKGNTLLKFDKEESEAQIGEDIILKPQLSGQMSNYKIVFNNISNLNKGVYKICYKFTVNNKQFGDSLYVFLIINEMNSLKDKIKEFREQYMIDDNITDSEIGQVLEKCNFDFVKAFEELF